MVFSGAMFQSSTFAAALGPPGPEARGHWVRLRTLITLRWLALAGQTAAVFAAVALFDLDVPVAACLLAIAAPAGVNFAATRLKPANTRLNERHAMLWLLFDLAQLFVMLGLTGGLTNPFAVLLLAPVTIAASVLTLRSTLILASAAMAATSVLLVAYRPLGDAVRPPDLYLLGVWAAITVGIVFMAIYTRRIGLETARMSEALAEARLALSREQRLTAIGALAAAAAHELGTPLATIKLISGELARDLKDRPELAEDVALLRSQADRCRDILQDLSQGGRADAVVRHAPLDAVLREAAGPHVARGKTVAFRINGEDAALAGENQPMVIRRPEVIHGLRNLVQNAVDFAATTIWIEARESDAALRVSVSDDGPGFKPDVLEMIGDPYVTTRGRGRRHGRDGEAGPSAAPADGAYQGMGLGLFIAKTLLERTGARVVFANAAGAAAAPGARGGAVVAAIWPRDAMIVSQETTRGPLGRNPRFEEEVF
ncbi:two-component system, sensor histidine kinase RegB [Rubrimonas cliftonensis]|uniref:histidine kinase n=2 Tax=Rubrimonas cliftonensis TaxID=89524 RepID=A0A1H4E2G2_9RHOB|nr:two-component system, sensor histidine kinase RegB [Rubrimonas cliftonensis]